MSSQGLQHARRAQRPLAAIPPLAAARQIIRASPDLREIGLSCLAGVEQVRPRAPRYACMGRALTGRGGWGGGGSGALSRGLRNAGAWAFLQVMGAAPAAGQAAASWPRAGVGVSGRPAPLSLHPPCIRPCLAPS